MATTLEGFGQVVVGGTACSAEVICFPLRRYSFESDLSTSIYVVVVEVVEHILLLLWLYAVS